MRVLVGLLVCCAMEASAAPPEVSPVPPMRPAAVLSLSTMSPHRPTHPLSRPESFVQKAMAQRDRRRGGGVCGDPDIAGEEIPDIPGRIEGCGIRDAVRVRAVAGVGLSQEALMNCRSARVLSGWVRGGLRKSVGRTGGGVAGLKVAAHYVCRTRNHQPGAPVSEHGKGNAIDISEIRLQNGDTLNVLRDWGQGEKGRVLRKIRDSGCGPFGTVLGPGSDGFHRDHFHFDSAKWGTGPICR